MQNAEQSGNLPLQSTVNMAMARVYLSLKKTDSSLINLRKAYEQALQSGYKRYIGSILLNMGRTYAAMGNKMLATEYFRKSLDASREHYYFRGVVASNLLLAEHYKESSKKDSVFFHINEALSVAKNLDAPDLLLRSYTSLTDYYQNNGNNDSAVKYQALIIKINDSLFNVKRVQQFQNIDFDEQQRQQQIEAAKMAERAKFRTYLLLSGLAIFLVIAIMLWRNSQHRKKANILLSRQKNELEITLDKLKKMQNQLVQSEKMASLGELTAGIAHEIQNPLNFVNNFSEVNKELLVEMKHEMKQGNLNEANSIADNIINNQEKINHHGKRADAIVKGMLQHSRTSSGQKELTDINALTGEYSRLAYHGFKAKDKTLSPEDSGRQAGFNATLETNLDPSVEKINVVPQDIGRVLFNLVNNAFYAVSLAPPSGGGLRDANIKHEPIVKVSTKKVDDKVEIRVKDNGPGISQEILDKIFQPFFTTKPAGQGTGLGLSLSYDIVKAHGGDINVQSKEGDGSEFIIKLPIA
jgi:signal transduction histidine kinase